MLPGLVHLSMEKGGEPFGQILFACRRLDRGALVLFYSCAVVRILSGMSLLTASRKQENNGVERPLSKRVIVPVSIITSALHESGKTPSSFPGPRSLRRQRKSKSQMGRKRDSHGIARQRLVVGSTNGNKGKNKIGPHRILGFKTFGFLLFAG